MELPMPFNRWVNDNNPAVHLEYGKGWWVYVEILQRLIDKFAIEESRVVGISAKSSKAHVGPTLGLFNRNTDLRLKPVSGFEPDWVYPPHCESPTRFSCELQDEWDLAAFIGLISNENA